MPKKTKSKPPVITFSAPLEDTSAVEESAEEFEKCPKVKRVPWYGICELNV